MGLQNNDSPLNPIDMENTAQSSRQEARIIHLRIPETPIHAKLKVDPHIPVIDLYTLTYLDQLLDEHFKWNEPAK